MTRVGVLGPGGVGGVLAARLDRAGHEVVIVATERTAAAIGAGGLQYSGPDGEWSAAVEARSLLAEPVEVLVVATKAMDLTAALQRVPAGLLRQTVVVPLLNGIDHLPYLRAQLPGAEVVASSISVEATRHRPGVVEQVSAFIDVGVCVAGEAGGRTWATLAQEAGCAVTTAPDDATILWRKLSFLAPLALVTSSAAAPIGPAIQARPSVVRPIVDEAAAAAATAGVTVDADVVEQRLRALPEGMKSSMLRDLETGRPMELDAIAGPIIRALGRDGAPSTVEAVTSILARA